MEAKFIINCAWCGKEKACTRSYRKYCSTDCSRSYGRSVLAEARARGVDPAQTESARKRRIAYAKKRAASGEFLGRALVKERRRQQELRADGKLTELPSAELLPAVEGRPVPIEAYGDCPSSVTYPLRGHEYAEAEIRWSNGLKESDIITLAGHGCSIRVERGELVLKHGCSYTGSKEPRILVRGMHKTSAIVMIGGAGAITLQAIQWCSAQKVAIFAVDRDGDLSSIVSLPAVHSAALHRLQHRANSLDVAREVVKAKIEAGIEARPMVRDELLKFKNRVDHVTNMSDLRMVEANAAIPYWKAWHFTLKTAGRHFPDHWRDFNMRGSTITVGNRKAVHPVNAMLNYGYAILAGQLQRALETWGFDVCLGTLHTDFEGRPSLVYDLIEPLRPAMDSQLLNWAKVQTEL